VLLQCAAGHPARLVRRRDLAQNRETARIRKSPADRLELLVSKNGVAGFDVHKRLTLL
jgi:hypothetical protein